jgi:hypothetical protein
MGPMKNKSEDRSLRDGKQKDRQQRKVLLIDLALFFVFCCE